MLTSKQQLSTWLPHNQIPHDIWSNVEKTWLTYRDSLTTYLKQKTKDLIQLQFLSENWQFPEKEESQILNISEHELSCVREINWCMEETTWIAARVIIPQATNQGCDSLFYPLGKRSIGNILFSDSHLKRSPFEYTVITKQHPYYSRIENNLATSGTNIWARRSVFHFRGYPLLINEIFFPALFAYFGSTSNIHILK